MDSLGKNNIIGILAAMDLEAGAILKYIENYKTEKVGNIYFYIGEYQNKKVVLAKSNEGKVNAAYATTVMIERFGVNKMLSCGLSGGLKKQNLLDIVIPTGFVQHDFDLSPLGYFKGYILGVNEVVIKADEFLVDKIKRTVPHAETGILASGDQFIFGDIGGSIVKDFNASFCDMESAAVAQVCKITSVPFAGVRVISDNADEKSSLTFEKIKELASDINSKTIMSVIEKL